MNIVQKILFFALMCFLTNILLAQDDINILSTAENDTNELQKIILERDWFNFTMGITWEQYQYLDGTLLKYDNVRSIISVVPENQNILKQERGWFLTNSFSPLLLCGSAITFAIFYNDDKPYADIIRSISLYSGLGAYIFMIYSNDIWKSKMRRAVNNYNLYIQGLPIP